jgi:hypothetical protein
MTMKNYVFWNITPCGSCENRVPPKRWFLEEPHGVTSQKTTFFISVLILHGATDQRGQTLSAFQNLIPVTFYSFS